MRINQSSRVALIGTGIMGSAIAGHILDAGYRLTVHNRTREKAEGLLARGATWADSPAQAARDADVVLTMVGYPTEVESVYMATDGLLRACRKGTWLIDLTTSDPGLAREIHDTAEVMDLHAFDCPVTGGESGAIDGTLTLIMGTTEKEAQDVLPLLECFSAKRLFFGEAGAGQTAKLCNQVSLASCMVGYADAVSLARESGIDPALVLEVMASGTGGSGASRTLAPKSLAGDLRPGFMVEHLRKDVGLAVDAAEDAGLALPGAETALALLDTLCRIGGARLGTQALTLLYEDEAAAAAAGLDWSLLDAAPSEDVGEGDHGCACEDGPGTGECDGHGGCHRHEGEV